MTLASHEEITDDSFTRKRQGGGEEPLEMSQSRNILNIIGSVCWTRGKNNTETTKEFRSWHLTKIKSRSVLLLCGIVSAWNRIDNMTMWCNNCKVYSATVLEFDSKRNFTYFDFNLTMFPNSKLPVIRRILCDVIFLKIIRSRNELLVELLVAHVSGDFKRGERNKFLICFSVVKM